MLRGLGSGDPHTIYGEIHQFIKSQFMENMTDRGSLDNLLACIRACRLCEDHLPLGPRPILRVSQQARLLICAQAPGTRVHETGLPFNDPSGDRLRSWLGIGRETFYDEAKVAMVPMGFCYPGRDPRGGDSPPRLECSQSWHGQLLPRLGGVRLKLVIGQYAQAWHLGQKRKASLTETVRAWRDFLPDVIPLPHPSPRNNLWLRRNPWFEAEVIPDLQTRIAALFRSNEAPDRIAPGGP